jgi:hypothetical protein
VSHSVKVSWPPPAVNCMPCTVQPRETCLLSIISRTCLRKCMISLFERRVSNSLQTICAFARRACTSPRLCWLHSTSSLLTARAPTDEHQQPSTVSSGAVTNQVCCCICRCLCLPLLLPLHRPGVHHAQLQQGRCQRGGAVLPAAAPGQGRLYRCHVQPGHHCTTPGAWHNGDR